MPVSVKLPAEFKDVYEHVFKQNPEESTMQLVIHELRRRLAEYRLMDRKFREKYNMNFDEFKQKRIVEELGHSFEVEKDYCDWEISLDGIKTINAELKKLASYT
jgi:hypothetical protein